MRQGDLLFREIKYIPEDAKPFENKEKNRVVFAYGEVTGHAHAVYEKQVKHMDVFQQANRLWDFFVRVNEEVEVKHEEHEKITLDKGNWEIIRQREYNYFTQSEERVKD